MPAKRSQLQKTQSLKRAFVITPGDPDGIGPEILIELFRSKSLPKGQQWIVVGAEKPFVKFLEHFQISSPENLGKDLKQLSSKKWGVFIPAPSDSGIRKENQGGAFSVPGFQSGWSIEQACRFVLDEVAAAMITGPIDKQRLNQGGYHFSGHTDFLAFLAKGKNSVPVTMMLYNAQLRASLVTTHVSLKDVPKALSRDKIIHTVLNTERALMDWFQIPRPRIALLALNPHAGDGGLLGVEERDVIRPAMAELQSKTQRTTQIEGPFPADSFFANQSLLPAAKRFDAVVAMYHDQGLIPVKLLDFKNTVNITLGLPFIRTSVDHGVAFDIVGKNKADSSSFKKAILEAVSLARR